jgi:hypothetical protein
VTVADVPDGVVDSSTAHSARRYNYWLGGKDNFAVDRESGDQIAAAFPTVRTMAVENRSFLRRTATFLAREAGIRQFLDVGTGLPTADNTHDVVQRIAPESRVVYVDNDPMVMTHARALLTSTPQGRTAYLEADLREPGKILADPVLRETLDLREPVGLMLLAVLHFIRADAEAADIVRSLVRALPAGSHLVISHATMDFSDDATKARNAAMIAAGQVDAFPRTGTELGDILAGPYVLDPGLVPVSDWRSEVAPAERPAAADVTLYGAVARLA